MGILRLLQVLEDDCEEDFEVGIDARKLHSSFYDCALIFGDLEFVCDDEERREALLEEVLYLSLYSQHKRGILLS